MKYIVNTGRYDLSYTYMKGAKEERVNLYRRRVYMDTGNIAISGVTPVEDEVFEALKENKAFARALADKAFAIEGKAPVTGVDKVTELEEENKALKAELEKSGKGKEIKELEKEKAKLEKENADMKAKLEALTNKPEEDSF